MAHDAATSPPAIDLGSYADLLGRTWLQDDKALTQELAKRNLGPDDWVNARAFWTKAIDEDAARGGKELVLSFAGRFEASWRAQPLAPAAPPTPQAAAEKAAHPEAPAPPAVAVPSYLAAAPPARPPHVAPSPPAPFMPAPTSPVPSPLAPILSAPIPPAQVPLPSSRSRLAGTALDSGVPSGSATPFVASKAVLLDGLHEYAALTAELALDPQRAAEVLARRQLTPAAKEALDAQWQAKLSRNAMSSLQFPRLVEQESVRLRKLRGVPAGPPSLGPRPKPTLGSTAFASPEVIRASIQKAALPFAGSAEPARAPAPDLTLPHYASLCVELAVAPERRAEILRRYGLGGEAEHAEIERVWSDRLAEDPARAAEFHTAVQSYRTWLLRK